MATQRWTVYGQNAVSQLPMCGGREACEDQAASELWIVILQLQGHVFDRIIGICRCRIPIHHGRYRIIWEEFRWRDIRKIFSRPTIFEQPDEPTRAMSAARN